MEVFKLLPEGTLAEIINGELYMSTAPTTEHQRIIRELSFAIFDFAGAKDKGEVFFAPYDVFLDEHSNAVQPDIIFVSHQSKSIIKADAIHGTPDLLIEILPPGNPKHDLIRKKNLYQKFGVKEYWVINPESRESTGFLLSQGEYSLVESLIGKINSRLLDREFSF
jgi:Uma2 family endonuclease